MFFFDPMYLVFALPPMLFVLWAQSQVTGAFNKYRQVRNDQNMTGADVAAFLLRSKGLGDVSIEAVPGTLTDHYDPTNRTLSLSQDVYGSPSVAAMGVAAHEVGHVVQHYSGYTALKLRSALVPAVNIGSNLGYIFFFAGIVIGMSGLVWLGVAAFSMGLVFALVTLPVEFDASNRALAMLKSNGLVGVQEYSGAQSVLRAAAWTYVAAVASALGNLLYFVFIALGMSRRDD